MQVKTEKGQETPARTQLGATTVLAVVTVGFGGKAKPQVYHVTTAHQPIGGRHHRPRRRHRRIRWQGRAPGIT
jgi:hypothetical protein